MIRYYHSVAVELFNSTKFVRSRIRQQYTYLNRLWCRAYVHGTIHSSHDYLAYKEAAEHQLLKFRKQLVHLLWRERMERILR